MGGWYERDAAWHAQHCVWGPVAGRKEASERMILNLEEGMTLMHVQSSDPAVPDRLMLLLEEEPRPPHTGYWVWRTWIPFTGRFDLVKRVCILTQGRTVLATYGEGMPQAAGLRAVPDRIRLVAMFARWRDTLLARQEARAVELRLCLLRLGRYAELQALAGM